MQTLIEGFSRAQVTFRYCVFFSCLIECYTKIDRLPPPPSPMASHPTVCVPALVCLCQWVLRADPFWALVYRPLQCGEYPTSCLLSLSTISSPPTCAPTNVVIKHRLCPPIDLSIHLTRLRLLFAASFSNARNDRALKNAFRWQPCVSWILQAPGTLWNVF